MSFSDDDDFLGEDSEEPSEEEQEAYFRSLNPEEWDAGQKVVTAVHGSEHIAGWKDASTFREHGSLKGYTQNTEQAVNKAFNADTNPYRTPELIIAAKHRLCRHTIAQMVSAAQGWVVSGSIAEAARISGVGRTIISHWKLNTSWWPEVVRRIKVHQMDSVETMLNVVISKSLTQIIDRLDVGDEVLTKDGDKDYVKVKAKDLASIVAQMQTTRKNMSENQVDSVKEVNTLSMLEEKLRSIAKSELGKTVVAEQ